VWGGMLGSEKVCVKVLRIYNVNTNKQKGPLAVCGILLVRSISADAVQAFLRRSGCLEETETSKCGAFFGCYDDAITARIGVDASWYLVGIREWQSPRGPNRPRAYTTTPRV
jgi:hypothetical protein